MRACLLLGVTQLLLVSANVGEVQEGCCKPSQPCWPTNEQLADLEAKLEENAQPRSLTWEDKTKPRPIAIPEDSNNQPLFGYGKSMRALYVEAPEDREGKCFLEISTEYCAISARSAPHEDWTPRIVAWPTSRKHVQHLVKFARKHNICVSMAGTSHDLMNRHSTDGGLFIRTTFLKGIEVNTNRNFWLAPGHKAGTVTVGAGVNFEEIFYELKKHGKLISSGTCSTVGPVGWSTGGGFGPFSPKLGLGADNIVEATLVLANGRYIKANRWWNRDLFKALRGGGAATWGVVISLTLKMHDVPQGGITTGSIHWSGTMCNTTALHGIHERYRVWAPGLNAKWSGEVHMETYLGEGNCGGTWSANIFYFYFGGQDAEFQLQWGAWQAYAASTGGSNGNATTFAHWWDRLEGMLSSSSQIQPFPNVLNPAFPFPYLPSDYPGSLPSVMVDKEHLVDGSLNALIRETLDRCLAANNPEKKPCTGVWLAQAFTGNVGSPQLAGTSLARGLRKSLLHVIAFEDMTKWYNLGEHSYFGESAYIMEGWQNRYWDSYDELLAVKKKYDPQNFFWCRHCVGSELPRTVGDDHDDDHDDSNRRYKHFGFPKL